MSNYETMKDRMSSHFLEYDQEKMIQKFALDHDEKYLYIFFVGRKYRINRITGGITWSVDEFQTEENANYNEAMTIYDVLCNSKEYCHPAHEWVHIGSLSTVRGGNLANDSNFFRDAEKGDVAYQLEMFSFLPAVLRFWESDDEFPASLQVLVDRNILEYMHYETVMFAIGHLLERVGEEME